MTAGPMPTDRDHEALIERLVADAAPVRRLWSPGTRLGVWLGLCAAVFLYSVSVGLRPDLGVRLRDVPFLLEVGALIGAGIVLAALALAAAVPGRAPSMAQATAALALGATVWLIPLYFPIESSMQLGVFLQAAAGCQRRTTLLAALPALTLFVALRRGAPLAGAAAGALASTAAFLVATGVMRLVCASDARFHLLVGHVLPGVVALPVMLLVGRVWLHRWRTIAVTRT